MAVGMPAFFNRFWNVSRSCSLVARTEYWAQALVAPEGMDGVLSPDDWHFFVAFRFKMVTFCFFRYPL